MDNFKEMLSQYESGVDLDCQKFRDYIKDVEDKLERLTNIIEGTNLGIWEWNIKTDVITINEQWANMIGYSLDEIGPITREKLNSFLHPEDVKKSNKMIVEHLNGETERFDCEIRMKHKDGRWIWINDRGKIIKTDNNGSPVKIFGTYTNINIRKQGQEALRENEKRFSLALEKTKAGLWDMDMVSGDVFLAPMWKNILGYEDDEIENSYKSWKQLWHPDDKEKIQKAVDDYLEGKSNNYEVIHRLKHKDGSWRWMLTSGGMLRDDDGAPYRWIGTHIDITKEQEQAIELERFFSINLDLLCILDLQGNFIKTNKAWEDVLGYSSQELQKHNLLDFVYKEDIQRTSELIKKFKNGEKVISFINRYVSIDGYYHHIEWRLNPYENVVYAAARDITERIEYEEKLLEISNRDMLTNVYNRRYIFNRLREIIEEYKRTNRLFSLCILDIDHFKEINDKYGHQVGDCALQEFTKIIDDNLRPYDILGRYGGEEFIIILNDTDEAKSKLVIKRILNTMRNKVFNFNGYEIGFTFSAGIVSINEINHDEIIIEKLVEIGDKRMYQAKKTGRNRIISRENEL